MIDRDINYILSNFLTLFFTKHLNINSISRKSKVCDQAFKFPCWNHSICQTNKISFPLYSLKSSLLTYFKQNSFLKSPTWDSPSFWWVLFIEGKGSSNLPRDYFSVFMAMSHDLLMLKMNSFTISIHSWSLPIHFVLSTFTPLFSGLNDALKALIKGGLSSNFLPNLDQCLIVNLVKVFRSLLRLTSTSLAAFIIIVTGYFSSTAMGMG